MRPIRTAQLFPVISVIFGKIENRKVNINISVENNSNCCAIPKQFKAMFFSANKLLLQTFNSDD